MTSPNGTAPAEADRPPLLHLAATRLDTIRNEELPQEVYDKAVLCLLDFLGALVSGLSAPWAGSLVRYTKSTAGGGGVGNGVWAIGIAEPVSVEGAAFHNAAVGHR